MKLMSIQIDMAMHTSSEKIGEGGGPFQRKTWKFCSQYSRRCIWSWPWSSGGDPTGGSGRGLIGCANYKFFLGCYLLTPSLRPPLFFSFALTELRGPWGAGGWAIGIASAILCFWYNNIWIILTEFKCAGKWLCCLLVGGWIVFSQLDDFVIALGLLFSLPQKHI